MPSSIDHIIRLACAKEWSEKEKLSGSHSDYAVCFVDGRAVKALAVGRSVGWAVDVRGVVYMSVGINAKREAFMSPAWFKVDAHPKVS